MDLEPLLNKLQGALWKCDRKFVLVVCTGKLSDHLKKRRRIKIIREPPEIDDPLLNDVALIIFAQPYGHDEMMVFRDDIGEGANKPKIIVWDHVFVLMEDALLNALDRNPIEGFVDRRKGGEEPDSIGVRVDLKPKEGQKLFARGELTAYIKKNAKPKQFGRLEDARRLYASIANKPGAPNRNTFMVTYHKLFPAHPVPALR